MIFADFRPFSPDIFADFHPFSPICSQIFVCFRRCFRRFWSVFAGIFANVRPFLSRFSQSFAVFRSFSRFFQFLRPPPPRWAWGLPPNLRRRADRRRPRPQAHRGGGRKNCEERATNGERRTAKTKKMRQVLRIAVRRDLFPHPHIYAKKKMEHNKKYLGKLN